MNAHLNYWNHWYAEHVFSSGKEPLRFLQEFLPRLSRGKALDVGMGEGVNAVYLAQKGFQVKGIDLSPVAVERAQTLARDSGVSVEAKAQDLDLFLFQLFEYDSVVMTYFKPQLSRYYSEILRTLKQGGTLLVESFTMDEVRGDTRPPDSVLDNYFKSNELLHALKGMRILFYHEGELDGHHVVQCLAQKPFEKDALKYGFGISSEKEAPGATPQQKLAESLFKKKP